MYQAIVHGDPNENLIHIDVWLKKHRNDTAGCSVCKQILDVKADKSPQVDTHFAHKKNSGCELTAKSGKAFERFAMTERVSAAEAMLIKQYALDNLESIYYRARRICLDLTWKEFLVLLREASEHNIWAFKNFNPGYLPYVLLCCQSIFAGIPRSNRPHPIFFVLEPSGSRADFWHLPAGPKQRIWRVDVTTGTCNAILMKLEEEDPWYKREAREVLKIPDPK